MKERLLQILNVQKKELPLISLLLLYSFFMGLSIAFYFTSSTTLMLMELSAKVLPYAYAAGGLVGYLLWLLYNRMAAKQPFSSLLKYGTGFLLLSVILLVLVYHFFYFPWISFVLFIWIRVFMFVIGVGFWGLAAKLFDLRQGKRLFGLISAGEVISNIIGFFSIPFLKRIIPIEDILYVAIAALAICMLLMIRIVNQNKESLSLVIKKPNKAKQTDSKSSFFKNRYFALIFIMALLPMLGICFADYGFLLQSRGAYPQPADLASFLGVFFGIMAVGEFLVKTFLSGRLLGKYGIKLGLILLPLILLVTSFLASIIGGFSASSVLFFSIISLSKLSERIGRTALYDPSYQILYQPLPTSERLELQGRIEGIPKALGNILAGLIIFASLQISGFNIVHFSLLFLVVMIIWVRTSQLMYKQYQKQIKESVKAASNEENKKSIIHPKKMIFKEDILRKMNRLFIKKYLSSNLKYFDHKSQESAIQFALNTLLFDADNCEILKSKFKLSKQIEDQITTYQSSISDRNIKLEKLKQLANSKNVNDKLLSCKLAGISKYYGAQFILLELIKSSHVQVRQEALLCAGYHQKESLLSAVIESLSDNYCFHEAKWALVRYHDKAIDGLGHLLNLSNDSPEQCLRIVETLKEINHSKGIRILADHMTIQNESVREAILMALSELHYEPALRDQSSIKKLIKKELYYVLWFMAAQNDLPDTPEYKQLKLAIEFELTQQRSYIFLLLSLIFDNQNIRYIKDKLVEGSTPGPYFLEILDITVSQDMKELLLPLFEKTNTSDILKNYQYSYPQEKLQAQERLADIIYKDYSVVNIWTKVCAIQCLDPKTQQSVLLSNLINPSRIICEETIEKINEIGGELKQEAMKRLSKEHVFQLNKLQDSTSEPYKDRISAFETISILKNAKLIKEGDENFFIKCINCAGILSIEPDREIEINLNEQFAILIGGELKTPEAKFSKPLFINNLLLNTDQIKFTSTRVSHMLIIDIEQLISFSEDQEKIRKLLFNSQYYDEE